MRNMPIGEMLKEYGYVTDEQIREALAIQKQDRSKKLGQILVEQGYITEKEVLDALGKRMGLQIIKLDNFKVDTNAVARIPKQLASKYNMIAIAEDENKLTVCMSDPLNFYAVEDVRQTTGMTLEVYLCESSNIVAAIDRYYAEISTKTAAQQANVGVDLPTNAAVQELEEADVGDDVPIVKFLNSLLVHGYTTHASDIHIEPFEKETIVRLRTDGMLVQYVTLAAAINKQLIARIKIMSGLDIAERRVPQDGHFRQIIEGYDMNVRVSTLPTVYGEKAVLRYLATNNKLDRTESYGMNQENYAKMQTILRNPNGIIYITGPTGSGKTTTLYMILDTLAQKPINVSTVEDPVERTLPHINQTQVNVLAGMTFAAGLRSLLRQDPDVIMVGETRDGETAEISVRAAITGHLVCSTLHTNDALSSIVRLEDMGVEPYLVANSVVGIVAQRLMRKVCPNCVEEYEPDNVECEAMGAHPKTVVRGKGCHQCNNTGYKGRIAIHEIVVIDKTLRRMIADKADMDDMIKYAVEEQHMSTLKASALKLVEEKITTVEEMMKVVQTAE
ncbi:MAG: type II/IV secretion system protein [Clostridia bacterium]|nr:type II/IV secretion system protein [Clostridia bacterium]MBR5976772.1 type II/IV secretion system protein [Clostridia bacterium]MBR6479603.1 type II/IV secretion system protein [Clostridia bacterium]MBR6512258.1 type II/IV secretion system protein [Clostridia bacterium]